MRQGEAEKLNNTAYFSTFAKGVAAKIILQRPPRPDISIISQVEEPKGSFLVISRSR
jgi:hypothetical protein